MEAFIYDIIGIGIGPFNLGMAALCEDMPLSCLFFDQNPEFNWHPGMMIPGTRLQVPFYADLVTVVDPTSKYTFLNYLKEKQRLFRFAIHENNFVTRKQYNDYCRWVADDLQNLRFNHKVVDIKKEEITSTYIVTILNQFSDTTIEYRCKHLVVGIGSVPYVPECLESMLRVPSRSVGTSQTDKVFHSSQYLFKRHLIEPGTKVTVIGSGQSAAEIFCDLLKESESLQSLSWFTSSERFYPMEYSKLSLEMTSPDYIEHFYSLSTEKRNDVLSKQNMLYKGINFTLINEIYDCLYEMDLNCRAGNITIQANTRLLDATTYNDHLKLQLEHAELEQSFEYETNILIVATGYKKANPEFLNGIINLLNFDDHGMFVVAKNYSIDNYYSVFVQNAEMHTHGFNAPDLGMGPYRNAHILNTILGYEHYLLESKITFQKFGSGSMSKS